MRLCLVVEAAAGGTGRHVIDLTRALSARGHEVTLVYSPVRADCVFTSALPALSAQVVALPMARGVGWRDLAAARRLTQLVRERGPFAIVHAHSSKAGAVARLAAVGGAARVYTPHALATLDPERGLAARALTRFAEQLLCARRTDALILVSAAEYDEATRLGLATKHRHLIANRLHRFVAVTRDQARAALGARPEEQWIGFIGRLSPQKAPLHFVAAALSAMRRGRHARALILGDGELAPLVEQALAASDFADRFTWLRDATAAAWIAALDVLVVTSRFEGLPYVMLEALEAGVPVVSTEVGGARELLGDGAGIVCSPEALAGALLQLLARPARLAALQAGARRTGDQCRGDRMVDETEALYGRLARA